MFKREYLKHQLQRAMRGAITNGIFNCHVKGLHSIVFHDDVVGRQRLFYTSEDHELGKNFMLNFGSISKDQSLAFHSHHCDITLLPMYGRVSNITPAFGTKLLPVKDVPWLVPQYRYTSAISGKEGKLKPTGKGRELRHVSSRLLSRPIELPAKEFHTVAVPDKELAAWVVFEGQEDPKYNSSCYTFNPNFDASQLYQPMTEGQIIRELSKVFNQFRAEHGR